MPPIEAIVEVLMTKTDSEEHVKDEPLILIEDLTDYFSGCTISYVEFSQGMIRNRTILTEIYEPLFNKRVFQIND